MGEEIAKRVLEGRLTVEVKSDFLVHQYGNVAIEYEFKGRPSGIAASKAAYYMVWFAGKYYHNELAVLIETDRLKVLVRDYYRRHVHGATLPNGQRGVVLGGQGKNAAFVLIPKNELLRI